MPQHHLLVPGRFRGGRMSSEFASLIHIIGESNAAAEIIHEQYNNDAAAPTHDFKKGRGTFDVPANAQQNDRVIDIRGLARSTTFQFGAAFRSYVDDAVVAGQNPAQRLEFQTNLNNTASRTVAAMFSTGFTALGPDLAAQGKDWAFGLLHVGSNSDCRAYLQRGSTDANAAEIRFLKSRGDLVTTTDVASDDAVMDISARPLSLATFFETASLRAKVDGAFVSGQRPPSRIEFATNIANATPTVKMVISSGSDGFVGISNGLFSVTERPSAHLHILGEGGDVHLHVEKVSTDDEPPLFEGFKARGTVAARTNATLNDGTLRLAGFARSTTYHDHAWIEFKVDAAVVAGQAPASRIEFYTNANNVAPTLQGKINSLGQMRWGPALSALATTESLVNPQDGHVISSDSGENAYHFYQIRASTSNGPNHTFRRCRGDFAGNIATPTNGNVQTDDRVMRLAGAAWSGATGWWDSARIDTFVDGTVTNNQRPGSRIEFLTNQPNGSLTTRMYIDNLGNIGFNTSSFGASSVGVIGIGNRTTAPTGNPSNGSVMYAEAGATKIRGSGGTTTTIANAEPHCPVCGRDYMKEYEHDGTLFPASYFAVCLPCLVADLESKDGSPKPYVIRQKGQAPVNEAPEVHKDPDGIAVISEYEEALERAAVAAAKAEAEAEAEA